MKKLLNAAAFLVLIGVCSKVNSAPSWSADTPTDNTGFTATATIPCTAHGQGTPGTGWTLNVTSERAGGGQNIDSGGAGASGTYSTVMPQPASTASTSIAASGGSNANHAVKSNNQIIFQITDSTTGGLPETVSTRQVNIVP